MVTLMPFGWGGRACSKVPKLLPSGKITNVRSNSSGDKDAMRLRTYWVWLTVEEQATARTAGGVVEMVARGKAASVPRCFRTNRPASLWTSST